MPVLTPPPSRSLDQRRAALRRANQTRVDRAKLKHNVKHGLVSVTAILLDPPEYAETMKVLDLLQAIPKVGLVKARRMMNRCRISDSKTVGGLSDRQRGELVREIQR